MNKYASITVLFLFLISVGVRAQNVLNTPVLPADSVMSVGDATKVLTEIKDSIIKPKAFKPDPIKVVWMGAIIPGYGQIMNKKYWKLPIVYGGFLGFAYAISWNSSHYQTYNTAYYDILRYTSNTDLVYKNEVDKNPSSASFIQIIPKGYTIDNYGGYSGFQSILKTKQESFRRYRDLSIILSVAYYALTLVDAYVDAQLYDFDISPDLSMHVQPALLENRYGVTNSVGLQCSFSLK